MKRLTKMNMDFNATLSVTQLGSSWVGNQFIGSSGFEGEMGGKGVSSE